MREKMKAFCKELKTELKKVQWKKLLVLAVLMGLILGTFGHCVSIGANAWNYGFEILNVEMLPTESINTNAVYAVVSSSSDDIVAGVWKLNPTVILTQGTSWNINFTTNTFIPDDSGGNTFSRLASPYDNAIIFYNPVSATGHVVIDSIGYTNNFDGFICIIDGDDIYNDELLLWLKANGKKQVSGGEIPNVVYYVYKDSQWYSFDNLDAAMSFGVKTDPYGLAVGQMRIFKNTLDWYGPLTDDDDGVVVSDIGFMSVGLDGELYNADSMIFQYTDTNGNMTLSYLFTDDGSGGLTTVYRQDSDNSKIGWLQLGYQQFIITSLPTDPIFSAYIAENSILYMDADGNVNSDFMDGYEMGYDEGYQVGLSEGSGSADIVQMIKDYKGTWGSFTDLFSNANKTLSDGWQEENEWFRQYGYDEGKEAGYNEGFAVGKDEGYQQGASAGFGENLLGSTLSSPFDALDQFVLYESSNGFKVTLMGVLGAFIAFTLLIAFLKMFAGG